LIKLPGRRYKSYLEKFAPPLGLASQFLGNLVTNLSLFLEADFHMKSGMKYLIESFYDAILQDTPVPIPYREILITARIMDAIFDQVEAARSLPACESQMFGTMPLQLHLREN
jgi:hypothetical protein